jgi:hypothetical protein
MVESKQSPVKWNGTLEEVEVAVEILMAEQLKGERALITPGDNTRAVYAAALGAFVAWADHYGLPTTARVLVAYLAELHYLYGADADELKCLAAAYLHQYDFDVAAPVRAGLKYLLN